MKPPSAAVGGGGEQRYEQACGCEIHDDAPVNSIHLMMLNQNARNHRASSRRVRRFAGVLCGRLELDLIHGFTPIYGDVLTVLTYGSRTGAFDQITLNGSILALQPNLALAPVYDFPGSADPRFAATPFAATPDSLTVFTTLPGDLNLDLTVGDDDLNALLSNFGNLNTTWISGDVTGDGATGDADLNLLLSNFGTSVVINANPNVFVANATVPEPGTLAVLCLGCLLLARRRSV